MLRKSVALVMGLNMLVSPALGLAATIPGFPGAVPLPSLATNSLPVLRGTAPAGVSISSNPGTNQLVINQTASQAIINWNSFNIGATAAVRFNQGTGTPGTANWQPNSSYVALNRIFDQDPTLIYGNLSADGKIYLINQNGILFGPNSRVNVNTLVASSFNMSNDDFRNGLLRFTGEDYQHFDPAAPVATLAGADPNAQVVNRGVIATRVGGSVYLIAPQVINAGSISAPSGIIGLVAATPRSQYAVTPVAGDDRYAVDAIDKKFDLNIIDKNDHLTSLADKQANVNLNDGVVGGEADNAEAGMLVSDSGFVGMYGKEVNQYGLVSAQTSVKTGGMIELLASDTLTLGPKSLTTTPVSNATDTADPSFLYQPGRITLGGFFNQVFPDSDSLPAKPGNPAPARQITVQGAVVAPAGRVVLEASERIFLDAASRIDVSGLWVEEPSSSALVSAQLNTVPLNDDYGQKNGPLLGQTVTFDSLNGSSIGNLNGSVNAANLTAREKSTRGGSITLGSNILSQIGAVDEHTTREIVVKTGAELDFAGGGLSYQAGPIATTKLVSGSTVYDLSTPNLEWLRFDGTLGQQQVISTKFGVTRSFTGLYLGGGTPLLDYSPGYLQGSDAGLATLLARQILLDGHLDGSATRGAYQNLTADPNNSYGGVQPAGGTLNIGSASRKVPDTEFQDFVVNEVEITGKANPLAADFGATDPVPPGLQGKTLLPADLLNRAGLSSLSIFANTRFTLDSDAKLTLAAFSRPGGATPVASASFQARNIDIRGEIYLPSGSVTLNGADNVTGFEPAGFYQPLPVEELLLENGSRIDVSGEKIDRTLPGFGAAVGHASGGSITLNDNTLKGAGVLVQGGATLDVSGGYTIDLKGKVTGADAGSIRLTGPNIVADGTLRGLSLPGSNGGTVVYQSDKVTVSKSELRLPENFNSTAPLAEVLKNGVILGDNALAGSGFTQIELRSYNDLVLEPGVTLAPSLIKLAAPVPGGAPVSNNSATAVSRDLVGKNSITLQAGLAPPGSIDPVATIITNNAARINIPAGAGLLAAPGGSLSLKGPNVAIGGDLSAPAGTIKVALSLDNAPKNPQPATSELVVAPTGRLSVQGYDLPIASLVAGAPAGYTALAGGSITLSAQPNPASLALGDIVVANGALLDVSGSAAAPYSYLQQNGKAALVTVASNPGSLSLSYSNSLTLDGALVATGKTPGLQGGSLSIARPNPESGLVLAAADLERYQKSGFDALSFASQKSITFSGDTALSLGRSLTLDAPVIAGAGSDAISLSAPYVSLTNSYYPANPKPADPLLSSAPQSGKASIAISSGALDVTGGILFSGFKSVDLEAKRDIRLSDRYYDGQIVNQPPPVQQGLLETAGDLTLKASRIYPTSQANFAFQSETFRTLPDGTREQNPDGTPVKYSGILTVLPGELKPAGPIYSAFGTLALNANGIGGAIDQQGYLAAPLGALGLNTSGRLALEPGSVTTTAGSAGVIIGSLDGDFNWTRTNNSNPVAVAGQPQKSITLNGKEVTLASGATLDMSGGGAISGYLFSADSQGSRNPLNSYNADGSVKGGVSVVLPDNSVTLPGAAVYLEANDSLGLKAGSYSLLPGDQYAFVPGALVVANLNSPMTRTDSATTAQGYQVVAGYATFTGSGATTPFFTGFTVRRASDLLKQGHFDTKQIVAGNAGTLSVTGSTTILNGAIKAAALTGYQGGNVSLSATDITVQAGDAVTAQNLDFGSPIPAGLANTMLVNATSLSGQGFAQLQLGSGSTQSLTVKSGAVLAVPEIALKSGGALTLESGSQLNALSDGGTGVVTLASNGNLAIRKGALVHASNGIDLTATTLDYQGALSVDHGALNLTANNKLYLVKDGYQPVETDSNYILYLPQSLWSTFGSLDRVGLAASGVLPAGALDLNGKPVGASPDLVFKGDIVLSAKNILTLDAGRIQGDQGASVQAESLTLRNSGKATAAPAPNAGGGTLTLAAASINVDVGNSDDADAAKNWGIVLDNFKTVNLNAAHDLTFRGVGTLSTAADLNLTAARITTAFYADANTSYKAANVTVDANNATVGIARSAGTPGADSVAGGSLAIKGGAVNDAGIINLPSGRLSLTASGAGGIVLSSTAQILAQGSRSLSADPVAPPVYTPGGTVALSAASGPLNLAGGSLINVSALESGDAGTVSLSAPGGVLALQGDLKGTKGSGGADRGGSFLLDAARVDGADGGTGISALAAKISAGGFDRQISVRARKGDLNVASGDSLSAAQVTLEADGLANDGGNIAVSGMVSAHDAGTGGSLRLSAQKDLTLSGALKANGTGPGSAGGEVYLGSAGGTVSLLAGGLIDLAGSSDGGTGGSLNLRAQRNGNSDPRVGPVGVNIALAGEIRGASLVVAEAFKVYDTDTLTTTVTSKAGSAATKNVSTSSAVAPITTLNPVVSVSSVATKNGATVTTTTTTVTSALVGTVTDEATAYMASNSAISGALLSSLSNPAALDPGVVHLRPGVEIRGVLDLSPTTTTTKQVGGAMTTTTTPFTWNLSPRFAGEPGVLTLRSSGDLTLNGNLVDHPSTPKSTNTLVNGSAQPSWGINLVAGSDLGAADIMALQSGPAGNLVLGSGSVVYSEGGALRFASAGDTVIYSAATALGSTFAVNHMYQNLGSYSGDISGRVGGSLLLYGGVIQSATGNIYLDVAGDLRLSNANNSLTGYGAIRTIGAQPVDFANKDYGNFFGGGNIGIRAGGDVLVDPSAFRDTDFNAWDSNLSKGNNAFLWSANYDNSNDGKKGFSKYFTQGFAAMGGGDVTVLAGGDFSGQAGSFGLGNLKVTAGGDAWGRLLVAKGNGALYAAGNVGKVPVSGSLGTVANPWEQPVIELGGASDPAFANSAVRFDANPVFNLAAQGNVNLGTVLNPTMAHYISIANSPYWDPTYARRTDMTLASLKGDLAIYGTQYFLGKKYLEIFPQSLEIASAGSVSLFSDIVLAPSSTGNLRLFAAGSITGPVITAARPWVAVEMSDASLDSFYAPSGSTGGGNIPDYLGTTTHGPSPDNALASLHSGDGNPVVVSAGGDISNLQLILPKRSEISAAGDLTNFYIATQNNKASDVTLISAGQDIIAIRSPDGKESSGFFHAGPGNLVVSAGGSIDLGTSSGVQEIGGQYNRFLGAVQGSDVTLVAGVAAPVTPTQVNDYFAALRAAGDRFSTLLAQGDKAGAQATIDAAREGTIIPLFQGSTGNGGNISMISSSVSTNSGKESLNIIASGQIDVGRTSLGATSTSSTGIFTASGGSINIFAGGDINVNESRVMTFFGGDITAWSDTGNINAGRGSKNAVNAQPPKTESILNPTTGKFETRLVFTPPSVGSGIRAVTYDPNSVPGGSLTTPDPGDIHLFAPKGVIDAGEAGIAGGKITLGATEVLNAKNISASAGSVGVPSASESTVSLGALSGAGSVAENSKMIEQSSAVGSTKDKAAQQSAAVDDFMSRWLDLKIVSFDGDDAPGTAVESERDLKKKKKQ